MSETIKRKSENEMTYINVFGVGLVAIAYYFLSRKKGAIAPNNTTNETASDEVIPINSDLMLSKGSRGPEVKRLQILMGITSDGIFGTQTEAALLKLKGVRQTSINQFLKSPTLNQTILKVDTVVKAINKLGTPIYNAIALPDSSYYSDNTIVKTIAFGREVGKIRSGDSAGNFYAVYYNTVWGTKVGFVKAVDVEKM